MRTVSSVLGSQRSHMWFVRPAACLQKLLDCWSWAEICPQDVDDQGVPLVGGLPHSHLKLCRRCNTQKPVTQFYKSKANADGYDGRCKSCDAVQCAMRRKRKERVEVHPPNHPVTMALRRCSSRCRCDSISVCGCPYRGQGAAFEVDIACFLSDRDPGVSCLLGKSMTQRERLVQFEGWLKCNGASQKARHPLRARRNA